MRALWGRAKLPSLPLELRQCREVLGDNVRSQPKPLSKPFGSMPKLDGLAHL